MEGLGIHIVHETVEKMSRLEVQKQKLRDIFILMNLILMGTAMPNALFKAFLQLCDNPSYASHQCHAIFGSASSFVFSQIPIVVILLHFLRQRTF